MKTSCVKLLLLLIAVLVTENHAESFDDEFETTEASDVGTCFDVTDSRHLCYCGDEQIVYDLFKNERCVNGSVVSTEDESRYVFSNDRSEFHLYHSFSEMRRGHVFERWRIPSIVPAEMLPLLPAWLALSWSNAVLNRHPMNQFHFEMSVSKLGSMHSLLMSPSIKSLSMTKITLSKPSTSFPSRSVWFFPTSSSLHPTSFFPCRKTPLSIRSRRRSMVERSSPKSKRKSAAEQEYKNAVSQGRTAVLLRQSEQTLDTFTVCFSLPSGDRSLSQRCV